MLPRPECKTCRHNANGICIEPKTLKHVREIVPTKIVMWCSQLETGTPSLFGLLTGQATR